MIFQYTNHVIIIIIDDHNQLWSCKFSENRFLISPSLASRVAQLSSTKNCERLARHENYILQCEIILNLHPLINQII